MIAATTRAIAITTATTARRTAITTVPGTVATTCRAPTTAARTSCTTGAPYRLYAPPYGYHWVRVGNDVLLTALATGVVLDVLYNIWY